jgi:hypothetical protein
MTAKGLKVEREGGPPYTMQLKINVKPDASKVI